MKRYIVFDLEWNQAGKSGELKDMPFEIIEIGAVMLDEEKTELSAFSRLIKPKEYLVMHHMNQEISHIRMEDLTFEDDFQTVCEDFLNWCEMDDEAVFCTWGSMDLTELQKNIRHFNMPPLSDGPIPYLDIQKLFSIFKHEPGHRVSLEFAVNDLDIEKTRPFHRALNDVYYTVEVFKGISSAALEKKISFDLFNPPKTKEEEIHAYFDTYSKYVSRGFGIIEEAKRNSRLWDVSCYICRKKPKVLLNWFEGSAKSYLCLCNCPEHGLLRSMIRFKKSENGGVYATRITHSVSDDDASLIYAKYEKNHSFVEEST